MLFFLLYFVQTKAVYAMFNIQKVNDFVIIEIQNKEGLNHNFGEKLKNKVFHTIEEGTRNLVLNLNQIKDFSLDGIQSILFIKQLAVKFHFNLYLLEMPDNTTGVTDIFRDNNIHFIDRSHIEYSYFSHLVAK